MAAVYELIGRLVVRFVRVRYRRARTDPPLQANEKNEVGTKWGKQF